MMPGSVSIESKAQNFPVMSDVPEKYCGQGFMPQKVDDQCFKWQKFESSNSDFVNIRAAHEKDLSFIVPIIVFLQNGKSFEPKAKCIGTLVNPNYILSSARCKFVCYATPGCTSVYVAYPGYKSFEEALKANMTYQSSNLTIISNNKNVDIKISLITYETPIPVNNIYVNNICLTSEVLKDIPSYVLIVGLRYLREVKAKRDIPNNTLPQISGGIYYGWVRIKKKEDNRVMVLQPIPYKGGKACIGGHGSPMVRVVDGKAVLYGITDYVEESFSGCADNTTTVTIEEWIAKDMIITQHEQHILNNDCSSAMHYKCPNDDICVDEDTICDGIIDCPMDGFDESQCEQNCGQNFNCGKYSFRTCISRHDYCDDLWDCPNGEDEKYDCTGMCLQGEFMCKDKRKCLKGSKLCDGIYDCKDHSDETKCITRQQCEAQNMFFCAQEELCINRGFRCDGITDCKDGSDEQIGCDKGNNCGEGLFLCDNQQCVGIEKRCDGINDCGDDSDEYLCGKFTMVFVGQEKKWLPLCFDITFTSGIINNICHRMGQWNAIVIKPEQIEPTPDMWGSIDNKPLKSCPQNMGVISDCKQEECSKQFEEDKTPTSLFVTDIFGKECLGHIIGVKWIIVSASCLKKLTHIMSTLKVLNSERNPIYIEVTEVIPHYRYSLFRSNRIPAYDIALLMTNTSLPARPICLPDGPPQEGTSCFAAEELPLNRNMLFPYQVINHKICNSKEHYSGALTQSSFCADTGKESSRKCLPEGTPVMCLSANNIKWFLSGFISYQYECVGTVPRGYGHISHPTVFSDVFAVKEWIRKVVGRQNL